MILHRATSLHKRMLFILAVGALLAAMLPAAVTAGNVGDSASGFGRYSVDEDPRTFAFTVWERSDGSFNGRAWFNNPSSDTKLKMTLQYLRVERNKVGYACGFIDKSTDPELIGERAIFRVVDNDRDRAGDPDQTSRVYVGIEVPCDGLYYGHPLPGCKAIDLVDFFAHPRCHWPEADVLYDVERGDIEVTR